MSILLKLTTSVSKIAFTLFFIFPIFIHAQEDAISINSLPNWVTEYPISYDYKDAEALEMESLQILNETQVNVDKEEFFTRIVYKISKPDGVFRRFTIEFDPDFRTIQIHEVKIIRDGKEIDLIPNIHLEIDENRKYVMGTNYASLSVLSIFFEDMIVGDIVKVSYTEVGFQPDQQGKFLFSSTPNITQPLSLYRLRVIAEKDRDIHSKIINSKKDFKIRYFGNKKEWLWTVKNPDIYLYSDSYPGWDTPKMIARFSETSTFEQINSIVYDKFRQQEKTPELITGKVSEITNGITTMPEKINSIFNFMQKEIDYLNYGYTIPKRPETVLTQKFGDCKSMSLLTIKMLEEIGINSWPLLVRSSGYNPKWLDFPSEQIFNHCIVEFELEGQNFLFDPTRDPQGGKFSEKYVSDFIYGLRIKKGESELIKLSYPKPYIVDIKDLIEPPTEDSIFINREIVFEGEFANEIRNIKYKGGNQALITKLKERSLWYRSDWFDEINPEKIDIIEYLDSELENKIFIKTRNAFDNTSEDSFKEELSLSFVNILSKIPYQGKEEPNRFYNVGDLQQIKYSVDIVGGLGFKNNDTTLLDSTVSDSTSAEEDKTYLKPDSLSVEDSVFSFFKSFSYREDTLNISFSLKIKQKAYSSEHHPLYKKNRNVVDDEIYVSAGWNIKDHEPEKGNNNLRNVLMIFFGIIIIIVLLILLKVGNQRPEK